jgi:hypothetical protein
LRANADGRSFPDYKKRRAKDIEGHRLRAGAALDIDLKIDVEISGHDMLPVLGDSE